MSAAVKPLMDGTELEAILLPERRANARPVGKNTKKKLGQSALDPATLTRESWPEFAAKLPLSGLLAYLVAHTSLEQATAERLCLHLSAETQGFATERILNQLRMVIAQALHGSDVKVVIKTRPPADLADTLAGQSPDWATHQPGLQTASKAEKDGRAGQASETSTRGTEPEPPSLDQVTEADLRDNVRLGNLLVEAMRLGLLPADERGAMDGLTLAVRALARDKQGTPGKFWAHMLRQPDNDKYVTSKFEDAARQRIQSDERYRISRAREVLNRESKGKGRIMYVPPIARNTISRVLGIR